jgi:hypothetical protein
MLEVEVFDQPDGSAIAELKNLDKQTLYALAGIGFLKILSDRVDEVLAEAAVLKKEIKRAKKKRK